MTRDADIGITSVTSFPTPNILVTILLRARSYRAQRMTFHNEHPLVTKMRTTRINQSADHPGETEASAGPTLAQRWPNAGPHVNQY